MIKLNVDSKVIRNFAEECVVDFEPEKTLSENAFDNMEGALITAIDSLCMSPCLKVEILDCSESDTLGSASLIELIKDGINDWGSSKDGCGSEFRSNLKKVLSECIGLIDDIEQR